MTGTILVGINDSAASFAAADVAIAHARRDGAVLRAVAVVDHEGAARGMPGEDALVRGHERACAAALDHVARRAAEAGVEIEPVLRRGRIAARLLAEAEACHAAMIVLGRMERPGHVIAGIGSHTLHVIEFARIPVLVVPAAAAAPDD
ncbi:universal stress protein [Demequina rhizosphaerae]|uniref:universal stress protein n=1 Tax=Demequina rhizosphaerae TaxID=1638985 RepID=UPI00078387EB|nr:universal stress protein [Demequina rhizosphaerae]